MIMHTGTTPTYKARWATQRDFGKIVAIYKPTYIDADGVRRDKPKTVFERTFKATADSIAGNRTLLLADQSGDIKLLGTLHLLPLISGIAKRISASGQDNMIGSAKLNALEIGGVYRPGDGPSGFCLDLIYNALILQALKKARECTVGILTTQIVANNISGIEKLMGLQQGWEECLIASMYSEKFKETLAEPADRETKLASYVTDPQTAVMAAVRSLMGMSNNSKFSILSVEDGIIETFDRAANKKITIDMSQTELLGMAHDIAYVSSQNNQSSAEISWSELSSALITPSSIQPFTAPSRSRTKAKHTTRYLEFRPAGN